MRRYLIPLLSGVVAAILLVGCVQPTPAPAPAPVPEPTPPAFEIPPEPPGFPQPNPYWGLGFKPDGTRYQFGVITIGMAVDFWAIVVQHCVSQLERSGAEVSFHDPNLNIEDQVAMVEDLVAKNVDGICIYPVDTAGIGPAIDKAGMANIPVFVMDTEADSEYATFFHSFDALEKGRVVGRAMVELADAEELELHVYELFCPMSVDTCVKRDIGFNEVVAGSDRIKVTRGPFTDAVDEPSMNAIVDAFTADPTLNSIYLNGGMFDGTVQALKNIGRWAPIGEPDHVYWFAQDLFPAAALSVRSGHLHGVGMNDPWAHGDAGAKACLLYVCMGKTVPKTIITPVEFIDLSNIDDPPWGQPKRWGEMVMDVPDPADWPILDRSDVGLETPRYQP